MVSALKDLTNENTGPLAILEENYDDIMDSIDSKIEFEEKRIAKLEDNLREKYARLDALLGQYENIGTALSGQISQLDE
jgi:flagellar hook-associated protein 2